MIDARALVTYEDQRFALADVRLAEPTDDQLLVRCAYSGVSVGTEFALIRNKISWGPYPLVTGYMAAGVIEAAGSAVEGFEVGQSVYYRANGEMQLPDETAISVVSGCHCSHAVVTPTGTHGAGIVPDGLSLDLASMFVMPAVGHYGVELAQPKLDDLVVVIGAGMIGLGVVASCAYRGCRVMAVDIDDQRLAVAEKLGAMYTVNSKQREMAAAVRAIEADGADVVFECTGLPTMIDPSIALCRVHGTFVWQGNYGAEPVSMHFLEPHGKRLRMIFPCDDGLAPCRRVVVNNMAAGRLDWAATMTHRIESTEAPELFQRINEGQAGDLLGATICWA